MGLGKRFEWKKVRMKQNSCSYCFFFENKETQIFLYQGKRFEWKKIMFRLFFLRLDWFFSSFEPFSTRTFFLIPNEDDLIKISNTKGNDLSFLYTLFGEMSVNRTWFADTFPSVVCSFSHVWCLYVYRLNLCLTIPSKSRLSLCKN